MTATTPHPLPPHLNEGLKRLKMAAMRQLAPELLVTAKTQSSCAFWSRPRSPLATPPTHTPGCGRRPSQSPKLLEEFDVAASSIPPATFDYLASLEWIRAAENLCLIGPAGTGRATCWSRSGSPPSRPDTGFDTFTAADRAETLYRGLADNSVGKVIDTMLRNDLIVVDELGFAPLDDIGAQLLFRFVAAAYEGRSLRIGSHWPFESWGRFLPEHTTAVSMLDRLLHHCRTVITDGDS